MRFLFGNHYWATDENGYQGKSDYEKYGAVIRRFKNATGQYDQAWFIEFESAAEIDRFCRTHKLEAHIQWPYNKTDERFLVFNPFHECE